MAVADDISYEMLQDLLRSERRGNKLVPLEPRFWAGVRAFLEEVTAEFRAEQEKDPFSRRVMLLTDEVKNARQAADSVWSLRERKMSLYALSQVREAKPDRPSGLTPVEERIYDAILTTLKAGRREVLEGEKGAAQAAAKSAAQPASPQEAPRQAPATKTEPQGRPQQDDEAPARPETTPTPQPVEVPADTPDEDMLTIRALSDIPAFVGPDMQTYLLKEGDVATVPKAIAGLLERRKKAAVIQLPS